MGYDLHRYAIPFTIGEPAQLVHMFVRDDEARCGAAVLPHHRYLCLLIRGKHGPVDASQQIRGRHKGLGNSRSSAG